MELNNGQQPAFPNENYPVNPSGITKREYFAALALQGLLSNSQYTAELKTMMMKNTITDMNLLCAREAIDMADELLKRLDEGR